MGMIHAFAGFASLLAARDVPLALDCASALVVLFIFLVPFYLMMRLLAKFARIRYGFAPEALDQGPPIRICQACHNTVLELDFSHCPYCGGPLPPIEDPLDEGGALAETDDAASSALEEVRDSPPRT